MAINARTPLHHCLYLGEQEVDPVKVVTLQLIRNPQYARQRHPDCELNIYVVAAPLADSMSCPASYLAKITTTIGEIRRIASSMTGEDFNPPPPTEAQIAARKQRKQAKKAKQAERLAAKPPTE